MPRKSTGTVRLIGKRWYAKWTRANGSRSKWKPLSSSIRPDDRAGAKALAASMAPKIKAASIDRSTTVDAFADGVFDAREKEGKTSVGRERRMWKARVSPRLGKLPIATASKEQIEDFREYLDSEVRARIAKGPPHGLAGKSAMIAWTLVRRVFREASASRDRSKRVRSDDPTAGVLAPLKTRARKKTFLFPVEFDQLMASAVPIAWRQLYAIAAYLYLRPGELRALTWQHVDLDAGIVSVTVAFDEEARETKAPKTERGQREVPIPAPLLPLLCALREHAKARDLVAPLLAQGSDQKRARVFRRHLRAAKLKRERLFEDTATTLRVNFRSLRDSGCTWEALAGTPVDRIQARAGHEHIATTIGYTKAAEDLRGRFGTPFGPLPAALLESSLIVHGRFNHPKNAGNELRLLDSNQRPGG